MKDGNVIKRMMKLNAGWHYLPTPIHGMLSNKRNYTRRELRQYPRIGQRLRSQFYLMKNLYKDDLPF